MTLDTDQLWCSNFNPADEKILTKGEKKANFETYSIGRRITMPLYVFELSRPEGVTASFAVSLPPAHETR